MISFEDVSKSYRVGHGLRVILKNFTATIPTDENFGVLGGTGAGKSTLVRMIAGTELPDRGRVRTRNRVSFPVGSTTGFSPLMTGRENVIFVARAYSADPQRVVAFLEEFTELGPYMDEPVRVYSNGMKGRLSFGLAMAIPFDVYLVDETTSVGDAAFKVRCLEVFGQRLKTAKLLLATSNPKTLRKFCDRAALFRNNGLDVFDDVEEAIQVYGETQFSLEAL
jgi:capsular polysaccharide transport system ATP-binding protein